MPAFLSALVGSPCTQPTKCTLGSYMTETFSPVSSAASSSTS